MAIRDESVAEHAQRLRGLARSLCHNTAMFLEQIDSLRDTADMPAIIAALPADERAEIRDVVNTCKDLLRRVRDGVSPNL